MNSQTCEIIRVFHNVYYDKEDRKMSYLLNWLALFIVIMMFGFVPGVIVGAYLHEDIFIKEDKEERN